MTENVRDDEAARSLPDALWERIRADPVRAPEHIALAAAEKHGPSAQAWLAAKRALYALEPIELAQMAKKRHASLARLGGAAGGVGGFVTMLPDIAAAVWIQSRLIYYVAASFGYDPLDRMRPAEQLVLQGIYENPAAARAALDGAGTHFAQAVVEKQLTRSGADTALLLRLAQMVGKKSATKVAARMIPGFAMAYNAVSNERNTRELADRAIKFYGG